MTRLLFVPGIRAATAIFLALCAGVLFGGPSAAMAGPDNPAFTTALRMGRGVNVLGYDGIWDGGTDAPFRLSTFAAIRAAGFRHVRINLFGFKYMNADNLVSGAVLSDLDRVLDAAIGAGLVPVIDEHDNEFCQANPRTCATKLLAFWTQISARYAGRYPEAVFEILNEPGGDMTSAAWNELLGRALRVIRAGNPERTVIVAAINSDDPAAVRRLRLPEDDRNLIVTVHYYKPFRFTHQGAPWEATLAKVHDVDWGSSTDRRQVTTDLAAIAKWAEAAGRPVYLGEFGAYEGAPMAARARYVAFVARSAEQLGWPWAYWQFDHDFALFDETTQSWVAPILAALIPAPAE